MQDIQNDLGKQKLPSSLNDPFNTKSIRRIYVSYSYFKLSKEWEANGSVEFVNGNTTGEQKFSGKTFDEVVAEIKAFIIELQKNSK